MAAHVQTGIPTTYRAIRFRSRLEAKWAAFFDALGWPWEYEPLDLPGYIPDFILRLWRPTLVEVKPALSLEELGLYTGKIDASGWKREALLVGSHPFEGSLGILREAGVWEEGVLFSCLACAPRRASGGLDRPSLRSDAGGWHCRFTGCYEGNAHVEDLGPEDVRGVWAAACNQVQWMADR